MNQPPDKRYAVRTIDDVRRFDPMCGETVSTHDNVEDAAQAIRDHRKVGKWRIAQVYRPGVYRTLQGDDIYRAARVLDPDRSST